MELLVIKIRVSRVGGSSVITFTVIFPNLIKFGGVYCSCDTQQGPI